jgi:hypothetical protein
MLLLASVFSMLTGDMPSFIIISTIVLLSVTLDFFQELRAANGINALRSRVALKAALLRDGVEKTLPVTQVVPVDIISLSAGDLVPADAHPKIYLPINRCSRVNLTQLKKKCVISWLCNFFSVNSKNLNSFTSLLFYYSIVK